MKVLRASAMAAAMAVAAVAADASPRIWPSGDSVPANLLRIELALDRPLPGPLNMAQVTLKDEAGQPIPDPFLDMALASEDGRHITILMHPGRIKTGVGPNTSLGLALHAGQRVTLRIADAQLPTVLEKAWQVGPARQAAIDPQAWRLTPPRAGSRDSLQVRFPSALGAHAQALIAVSTPDGRRLEGIAELLDGEMRWRFSPRRAWQPGHHELRVHASLEDPEGNRMCSAFEQTRQSAIPCNEDVRLPFNVASPAR